MGLYRKDGKGGGWRGVGSKGFGSEGAVRQRKEGTVGRKRGVRDGKREGESIYLSFISF